MTVATETSLTFTTGANTSQGRIDFANFLRDAAIAAGMTLFDSYGDGTNENRVMSYPLNPSGTGYTLLNVNGAYISSVTQYASWSVGTHTGTNASVTQSVTVTSSSSMLIKSYAHPELRGFNLFRNGVFNQRVFHGSPLNLYPDWTTTYPNNIFFHATNVSDIQAYLLATNIANLPTSSSMGIDGITQTVANARTGRTRARVFNFAENTYGASSGIFSDDVILVASSSNLPLESLAIGGYKVIYASGSGGIAIRIS